LGLFVRVNRLFYHGDDNQVTQADEDKQAQNDDCGFHLFTFPLCASLIDPFNYLVPID
jgi:hypothetical protein